MPKRQQVGLCLIATRKYKKFINPLIEGIKKYFLPNHDVTVFLFVDENVECVGDERVKIEQHPIPSFGFPEATLYRYRIFDEHFEPLSKMDYLFYSDIDMSFVDTIGDEILGRGLTVVYHPGFYSKKEVVGNWGSNGVVKESLAWIEPEKRVGYVAGGFNGGSTVFFQVMANHLNKNILKDEINQVRAEYHDESHLNAYLKNDYKWEVLYLDSGYCMVESEQSRKEWGIDHLPVKIIALDKNHSEIRS